MAALSSNDWGGRGYDDFVPGGGGHQNSPLVGNHTRLEPNRLKWISQVKHARNIQPPLETWFPTQDVTCSPTYLGGHSNRWFTRSGQGLTLRTARRSHRRNIRLVLGGRTGMAALSSNDWGGRGYDDSVPGGRGVTKTAPSRDRTAWSSTWPASLPRNQFKSPGSWSNTSRGGAVFVPSSPKMGTNLRHPPSPNR